ncbi:Selenocysteine insertion sequence-binding protein 2, partial [Clarias magur]
MSVAGSPKEEGKGTLSSHLSIPGTTHQKRVIELSRVSFAAPNPSPNAQLYPEAMFFRTPIFPAHFL